MNITDFIDPKALQDIQDQFSDATGLAAIAVDNNGNYITEGSNFTDFCMKYTRGSEEGLRRCVKCDNECSGTYFCHAGLMDFSSDIMVHGQKVGAIIGGQVLPKEPNLDEFRQVASELCIDPEKYITALKKVPVRTEKRIRAAAAMLGNVVNQLVNLEYIKKQNQTKVTVFDEEIETTLEAMGKVKTLVHDLQKVASKENILSLNASIEAARAGEAGVGFMVVAKEIGALAKQSANVYGEIQQLVNNIEASVQNMKDVK